MVFSMLPTVIVVVLSMVNPGGGWLTREGWQTTENDGLPHKVKSWQTTENDGCPTK
jgi:hypothetical protein